MGRMHSKGKGMSGTALPYKRTPPSWLKFTDTEVRTLSHRLQQQQLYLSLRSAARLSASSPGWSLSGPGDQQR